MKQYYACRDGFTWKLTKEKVEDGYRAWISAGFTPSLHRHDAERLAKHGRVDRLIARYFFAKREIVPFGRNRKDAERALEVLIEEANHAKQTAQRADLDATKKHVDMVIDLKLEEVVRTEEAFKRKLEDENGGDPIERYAAAIDHYADVVFYGRKTRWLYSRLRDLVAEQGHEQAVENMLHGTWNNLTRMHAGNGGVTQEKAVGEQNALIEFNANLRGLQNNFKRQRRAAAEIAQMEQAAINRREEVDNR